MVYRGHPQPSFWCFDLLMFCRWFFFFICFCQLPVCASIKCFYRSVNILTRGLTAAMTLFIIDVSMCVSQVTNNVSNGTIMSHCFYSCIVEDLDVKPPSKVTNKLFTQIYLLIIYNKLCVLPLSCLWRSCNMLFCLVLSLWDTSDICDRQFYVHINKYTWKKKKRK